jgi:hypothetical protein
MSMPIDLIVARYIMACNLMVVVMTLLVTTIRILRMPKGKRMNQVRLTLPSIVWCVNAFLFYVYTFFVKPYWDPIPDSDVYYFAWGAMIILHAAMNALGIELTRMRVDEY